MEIAGYQTKHTNTLRLWDAKSPVPVDMSYYSKGEYLKAVEQQAMAEVIAKVLYPDDNHYEGKSLRLKQQYFFVSATVQSIVRKHRAQYGTLRNFHEKHVLQINDTHPTLVIPELIRLLGLEGVDFDSAFASGQKTFAYGNHSVMAEAMERWDVGLISKLLPDVYAIIEAIDAREAVELAVMPGMDEVISVTEVPDEEAIAARKAEKAEKAKEDAEDKDEEAEDEPVPMKKIVRTRLDGMRIIDQNAVHMARLAVYASSYVNGVAEIHTQILKDDVLKDWYAIYPERFQNKTNGITQRRWLGLCNPQLSALLSDCVGDKFLKDLSVLSDLNDVITDETIDAFNRIKMQKKQELCDYIEKHEGGL